MLKPHRGQRLCFLNGGSTILSWDRAFDSAMVYTGQSKSRYFEGSLESVETKTLVDLTKFSEKAEELSVDVPVSPPRFASRYTLHTPDRSIYYQFEISSKQMTPTRLRPEKV